MKVGDYARIVKDTFRFENGTIVKIVEGADSCGDCLIETTDESPSLHYINKEYLVKVKMTEDISDLSEEDQKEILDLIEKKRRGVPKAKYIWIKKVSEDEGEDWEGVLATRTVYGRYCTFFEDGLGNPETWDIGADDIYEWVDAERPF